MIFTNHSSSLLFSSLVLCITIFSCQSTIESQPTKKIRGNTIRLDFKNIEEITEEDFILIDDLYISHSYHEDEWDEAITTTNGQQPGEYMVYAPASELHLFEETTGRRLVEKNSSFFISNKVGKIFIAHAQNNGPVYTITNGQSYLLNGSIELKRTDGKRIKMEVPEDYPVRISKS